MKACFLLVKSEAVVDIGECLFSMAPGFLKPGHETNDLSEFYAMGNMDIPSPKTNSSQ